MTECLAAALSSIGNKHVIWRMNPKAVTAPQLFGRLEASTGEIDSFVGGLPPLLLR